MILVGTSDWIEHLRSADADLALLERDDVATHEMVIGECATGDWRDTRFGAGSAGSRGPGRLGTQATFNTVP